MSASYARCVAENCIEFLFIKVVWLRVLVILTRIVAAVDRKGTYRQGLTDLFCSRLAGVVVVQEHKGLRPQTPYDSLLCRRQPSSHQRHRVGPALLNHPQTGLVAFDDDELLGVRAVDTLMALVQSPEVISHPLVGVVGIPFSELSGNLLAVHYVTAVVDQVLWLLERARGPP